MWVARHAQITQNNKFAIFLQYLKKELGVEFDFLQADKLATNWQYDFDGDGQAFPKVPKEQCLYSTLKKKLMKSIFCMQINIKVS